MDKIIEALYFSNIGSLDKNPTAQIVRLLALLDRHKKALEQKLDPDTQALFEKYADCYAELLVEQELEVFKQGFKLGMCFAIEGTDIQTK